MSDPKDVPVETQAEKDRRAADQQAALEKTFETGVALEVLPSEDRRHEPAPAESVTAEAPDGSLVTFVAEPERSLEDRVEVGGIIERTAQGWHVSLMYGGARKLHGDGATLENALLDAGV